MSLIFNECIKSHDKRKECVVFEEGKTYRMNNNSGYKVRVVKVDNCLPQKQGERRCDYLMDINDKVVKRVFFIELKGGDLVNAVRQIYSTMVYLRNEYKNYQRDARIVGSRDVPGFINTSEYKKLAKEILPYGTIERRTNKIYSENI